MTPEELVSRGGIYFEKIQNGMMDYAWESMFFSPRMADQYIRKLWEENGEGYSFVDCYYPFLEKESRERILSVLSEDQQTYLEGMMEGKRDLLVPLDEQILSIALELNDREMLFFSFYFLKTPCTIWGNYKQEYLIFRTPDKAPEKMPGAEEQLPDIKVKLTDTNTEGIIKGSETSGDINQQVQGEVQIEEQKKEAWERKRMRIFAHRGFSGKYPENTMLAFQKAYEEGCDGIELDVQLTKDDVLVIMHDETIDRTSNGKGNLRDYTYEQLCKFDCSAKFAGKYGFQKIPTLREYLAWVKDTGLMTNIELKNSVYYYPHLEEKVIALVREFGLEDKILFSSFNLVSVLKCKKLIPRIPAGFLMEVRMDNMGEFTRENQVEYYHPDLAFLTESHVRECHNSGVGVNVWTVNKKKEMKQMAEWGVDGIFTNYPDKANELGLRG